MQTNNPPALQALPRPTPECQNMTVLPCEGSNACGRPAVERDYFTLKVSKRAFVFPAWLRLLMIGGSSALLWSAAIWAALEIARWV